MPSSACKKKRIGEPFVRQLDIRRKLISRNKLKLLLLRLRCNNVPVTPDISTLSLHDALPIYVLAAQPVTTNLLKFMRASIKMIGVSNLQSFIASMTQKLTLSDISDESKN